MKEKKGKSSGLSQNKKKKFKLLYTVVKWFNSDYNRNFKVYFVIYKFSHN